MTRLTSKLTITLPALAAALIMLAAAASSSASPQTRDETPGPPVVVTGGARVVGSSTTFDGSVTPRTLATTYYFEYGPTNTFGSQTAATTIPAGTKTAIKVEQSVPGVLSGYHYRLVASNAESPQPRVGKEKRVPLPKARKNSGFELPQSFLPTVVGDPFVLSGTLTGAGNADREIVLQASAYPYRTQFANVAGPILTSATGAFSFRIAHLNTSTRFRVATVGTIPLYSKVVPELATVRVLLKVRTSKHSKGLVRLYGTVSPAVLGARVFFQLEEAARPRVPKTIKPEKLSRTEKSEEERPPHYADKFVTLVKRGTRGLSRFSLVTKVLISGNYRAFVVMPIGPIASGTSQPVLLHAGPAKRKHKRA